MDYRLFFFNAVRRIVNEDDLEPSVIVTVHGQCEDGFREADIRQIARFLGRVIVAEGDLREKRQMLLEQLAAWLGADAWAWTCHAGMTGQATELIDFQYGGFDETGFFRYCAFLQDRPGIQPDSGGVLTFSNGMVAIAVSVRSSAAGSDAIAFLRKHGPAFPSREVDVLGLVLSEIPWLHTRSWEIAFPATAKDLSPRLNTVLNHLLDGKSRKEIADLLHISVNTVHGYIKDIFHHFGVRSHTGLLQRCLHDGVRHFISSRDANASS